jgi:diphosphomevalonate decarboxylase
MHASAMAAGVMYFSGATLGALDAVRALREAGTHVYATMDAGPHVKVLVQPADAERVRSVLGAVPGVLRVIDSRPGPGASVENGGRAP